MILSFFLAAETLVAQPAADFKATPVSGCTPLKVDFNNQSSGAVSYLWRFGNGNISTLKNPSAVYNSPGKYTVTLIVTDGSGKKDSLVRTAYIEAFSSPVASLMADRKELCAGEQVSFADRTVQGDGPIAVWKWDFGDGGTATVANPKYTYQTPGTYDVTLAVTDRNGCEHSFKSVRAITVHALPSASFMQSPAQACKAPLKVDFDATVSGKFPLSYDWRFGDGGSAVTEDPSYTYNNGGTFSVDLTVTDGNKCSRKVTKPSLVAIKPPTIDFNGPRNACAGEKLKFVGAGSPDDGNGTYHWFFSNGDEAYDKEAETVMPAPGKYRVELRYTWQGCSTSLVRNDYVVVHAPPTGRLVPGDTAICRQKKGFYQVKVQSATAIAYQWLLNGSRQSGNSASTPVPLAANGIYRVAVQGTDARGCKAMLDSAVIEVRGPLAIITAKPWEGCLPLNVKADYAGKSAHPISKYEWLRPTLPPSSATGSSTGFTYEKFGESALTLKVTDVNGCTHDTNHLVRAGIPVKISFKTPVTEICRNQPFSVFNHSEPRSADSVRFSYDWNSSKIKRGKDSITHQSRNRTDFKLVGEPGAVDTLKVVANSHGCITRIAGKDRPTVLIKGPYVDGYVNQICHSDSLQGFNLTTKHTKTWWSWNDEYLNPASSFNLVIGRKVVQTRDLRIVAEDAVSGCRDSMLFPLKDNPNPVGFTLMFDCKTQTLETDNQYPDINDGSTFRWEFINHSNGKTTVFKTRNVKRVMDTSGSYTIRLVVSNPEYACDKIVSRRFQVLGGNLKGSISIDRNTCYPVQLTLNDPHYKNWAKATWNLGGVMALKDSAEQLKLPFTSYENDINVIHDRVDSNGCRYLDTFNFKINSWNVYMNVGVENESCRHAVLRLRSYLYRAPSGANFTYAWNVNGRIINRREDTVHVRRSMTVPIDLLVSDDRGCTAMSRGAYKVVLSQPVAKFSSGNTKITCPPLSVNFTDESESPGSTIVQRKWDFGDKTGSALRNPGKLYIYPGRYRVTLIVTNALGCSDTASIPDLVVVKGPDGSYGFDRKQGCTPLPVNLFTSIGGNVKKFEFDMGDGNVLDTSGKKHIYARPGMYIPRLILTDTAGCRFSPPPLDTIYVYANPTADFAAGKICDRVPHTFRSRSRVDSDTISKYEWWLNGTLLPSHSDSAVVRPNGLRHHKLRLNVATPKGCRDTVEKPFTVYRIKPVLNPDKEYHCLGEKVILHNATFSDTQWVEKRVWINGSEVAQGNQLVWPATFRGVIPVRLYMRDAMGCELDTTWNNLLKVGDTLPPPPLRIYRSTVPDDYSTATLFRPSAEPDFREYRLMIDRNGWWQTAAKSGSRHDTDLIAGGLQTLHRSYCHMVNQVNFCGKMTDTLLLLAHCTVETKALGDTNSAHVWWSPYSGWPVRQYRIYRKSRAENQFVLLDSVPGQVHRYTDTATWCKVIYDYRIEAMEHQGFGKNSFSDTAMAIPIHLVKVPAPEVWRTTVDTNLYTRTEWIMPVRPVFPVKYFHLYKDAGDGWSLYRDKIHPDSLYLNDLAVKVNRQSYAYRVEATDVCDTRSPASNPGVSILLTVAPDPDQEDHPRLSWNAYREWNEGVDQYIVQWRMAGGAFTEVGRTSGNTTDFVDRRLPYNCIRDVVYRVIAVRNQPHDRDSSHHVVSVSNWADFVPDMKLFIPNAFTPDANRLNETFAPKGVYIYSYHLRVYDRWGKKVYDGEVCDNAWDGMLQGEPAPDGVYAYAVDAWDMKGKKYTFSGTVHLLR